MAQRLGEILHYRNKTQHHNKRCIIQTCPPCMGDVRKVWREDNVVKLLQFTDGNGAIIVDYLRSLREVQSVAARKVLPPEEVREKVISDYRAALKSVVEAKVICETPKCRIITEERRTAPGSRSTLAPSSTRRLCTEV